VAKAMAEAYPESFVDRIGSDVVAAGYNDLLNRLCERRDNVNRVCVVTAPKRGTDSLIIIIFVYLFVTNSYTGLIHVYHRTAIQ